MEWIKASERLPEVRKKMAIKDDGHYCGGWLHENGFFVSMYGHQRDLSKIEWLDESSRTEWVSVKDKLPESTKEVLVWREYWDTPIQAYYFKAHNKWEGSREVRDTMKDGYCSNSELFEPPTHWMPLPNPPSQ